MKVDKEAIVKHHFWILLGVVAPLVLVALCTLWFGVTTDIKKKEEAVKSMKDQLSKLSKPDIKNSHWVDILEKKDNKVGAQKDKVWQEVWQAQSGLMTWPIKVAQGYPFVDQLYFLDDFYPRDLQDSQKQLQVSSDFRTKFISAEGYRTQLEPLANIVDPVQPNGKGTVQYAGGWQSVLTHVGKWQQSPLPTPEEIWMAQEDLWVQRELLNVVKESNTFVSIYKKEPNSPKPDRSKGEIDRQVFTNPYWKLDLILMSDQVRWQITNTSKQLQPLGIRYLIKLPGTAQKVPLWVDGEPLAPHQASKWQEEKGIKVGIGKTGLEEVRQELNWRTAPVKRIDRLALYYHSQRTSTRGLQGPPTKEGEGGGDAVEAAGGPSGDAGSMMGMGMARKNLMMGGGIGGQSGALVERTRYMDFGPQVRRMAVGMVLIVDQAHIEDVLAAFANSKLRIQITQVHWQHYTGSIKPVNMEGPGGNQTVSPLAGGPGGPAGTRGMGSAPARGEDDARGAGTPGGMMMKRSAPGMAGMQPFGPPVPGIPGTSTGSASDEPTNLVELAVYGIASLYQRFPPKSDTPAAAPAAN